MAANHRWCYFLFLIRVDKPVCFNAPILALRLSFMLCLPNAAGLLSAMKLLSSEAAITDAQH